MRGGLPVNEFFSFFLLFFLVIRGCQVSGLSRLVRFPNVQVTRVSASVEASMNVCVSSGATLPYYVVGAGAKVHCARPVFCEDFVLSYSVQSWVATRCFVLRSFRGHVGSYQDASSTFQGSNRCVY